MVLTVQACGTILSEKPSFRLLSDSQPSTTSMLNSTVSFPTLPNSITTDIAQDNDYNLEYNGNKTAGAARIVKLIKSYGLKIDGVGYQAHVASESTPTAPGAAPDQKTLVAALRATADLGVDVAYTELDLRLNTPATPEKLAVQAAAYERVAKSCLAVKRCVGMTVWVGFLHNTPN